MNAGELAAAPPLVPLFRWLLGGVVALLLTESALGYWFARRGA